MRIVLKQFDYLLVKFGHDQSEVTTMWNKQNAQRMCFAGMLLLKITNEKRCDLQSEIRSQGNPGILKAYRRHRHKSLHWGILPE